MFPKKATSLLLLLFAALAISVGSHQLAARGSVLRADGGAPTPPPMPIPTSTAAVA